MLKFIVAILILGMNSYVYWYLASDDVIPPRVHFSAFPDQLGDWRCLKREILEDNVLSNLMVSDYLACTFFNDKAESAAHVYIGYHERQTRDRDSGKTTSIHPPEHCLPGSGWDVIDSQLVPIDSVAPGGEAKRFVIAKGNQRSLVYFWYHSRGHVIARSHEKILHLFLDRARYGRTDGSLVRFTIPIFNGDIDEAQATFEELAGLITPDLNRYVPE